MNPILRRFWPYLALFAILGAALGWQYAQNPSHEERDIVQERLDYAVPPLTMEHSVGQTFLSRHDGLKPSNCCWCSIGPTRPLRHPPRFYSSWSALMLPSQPLS